MSSVKERLLSLLSDKEDKFLSGAEAAKKLDVSRAAVWKAVTSLRKDGYDIDAVTNRGFVRRKDNREPRRTRGQA